VLTRNPLESYVSLKIAQATGQWKLTNRQEPETGQGPLSTRWNSRRILAPCRQFQIRLLRALQARGQTAFYIDYDDIPIWPC
jgi:hypothetical protein